ncbi:TonB-linked SusC/RagA family outer membrane protein [Lacibacter cauensis]|uniref:TonB-linked SusC/RagA family outer membrane protein n=2 Tax=Lacibacter cauensis TaxID=510947 RepID=A0A562SWM9_9BACT|nr:TonB-linked SusC/RagA family outer membrane protein [Lacibacter cauensis]
MKRQLFAVGIAFCLYLQGMSHPILSEKRFTIPDHHPAIQNAVTGKVTDQNNEPLAGVTVTAKGTAQSVITDSEGNFSIQLPANVTTLVFSYVGFTEQEILITGKNSITVQLKPSDNNLSDIVIVGYGSQKKGNLTGAVVSISGAELTKRPVPNASNLLQGRVTGLQVTQPSAEPGRDNANLLIRGRSSFSTGTGPLVLIDGVVGNFNNISPNDIENVTVLKDAASASIYGSRAANGVILITTRKGKKGAPVINYSANFSRQSATELPDFITNSAEYMEMYNAAATRSGVAFKYDPAEIEKYRTSKDRILYPNFNAMDYYFRPAFVTNHNLSVSGGSDKNTYNLSASYLDQDALLPVYNFKRYNLMLNYTSQISKAVTIGTIMNMTYKDRKEPPFTSENVALLVYAAGPLIGPYLPDGSGRIASKAYVNEGKNRNVQEAFEMGWQNTKEYNLNAQAFMDVKLLKNFVWSSKVAVNYVDEYYKMYQHPYQSYYTQVKNATTGDYEVFNLGPDLVGVTDQYSKVISPTLYSTLTYSKYFGDHSVKGLAGYEQFFTKSQGLRGRRFNGVSSAIQEISGYTSTGEALNNTYPRLPGLPGTNEAALQSLFGRINYDYQGKYLIEANIRYDGTSRVSPDYRWGVFPSVSAGWYVSKENFVRDNAKWINNLKLRVSYGVLGNQDIGNYPYQDVLSLNVSYPFGNATPTSGAVINSFRDQSIRWESTKITDIGFDLDIFNGLFGLTFDWFKKQTYDILSSIPVPASLGLSGPTTNNGRMHAKGIELDLRHEYHIGKVSYGVNGNISTAKNKVDQIITPSLGSTIRQVGLPYDAHYLYVWDGIFQVEDIGNPNVPVHALNTSPKAGDLKMKDMNGDMKVDANDRVVVGGAYPDFIYSFGGHVDYNAFSLSFFFQGVEGIKARVNNWGVDPFMQGTPPTTKWRNAWTPQNRSNTLPAIYTAGYTGVAAYGASTYYLMDASYLRLKNVMLSYTVPASVTKRIASKGLTVYISGENLLTFTKYEGSDPERASVSGNFAQYPQVMILNAGFNIKF